MDFVKKKSIENVIDTWRWTLKMTTSNTGKSIGSFLVNPLLPISDFMYEHFQLRLQNKEHILCI